MLKIDMRVGDSVAIGDNCVITLEEKSGKVARIAFHADKSVAIKKVSAQTPAHFAAVGGLTGETQLKRSML